jgi:hypothetical protein
VIFFLPLGRSRGKHSITFPDAPYEHQREILFLKETNEHIAVWEKTNQRSRLAVSGIKPCIGEFEFC